MDKHDKEAWKVALQEGAAALGLTILFLLVFAALLALLA